MKKKITHIEHPKEWTSHDDYDSHRPLLWLVLENCEDGETIIEFGSGFGSTNLIRNYCHEHTRAFYSFDTDQEWCDKTGAIFISDFANMEFNLPPKVLFVDGKPGEQRKDLIQMHQHTVKLIVAHDTEEGADYVYKMKGVLDSFKYRLDYCPEGKPSTTVVSNYIDITKWIE